MENRVFKLLSDLPKCIQLDVGFKSRLSSPKAFHMNLPWGDPECRLHSGSTCVITLVKPLFRQDTTVCVRACVCSGTHNQEECGEKVVEKHPICYNFAWAVPVSKYHDNIFWSKDQRTCGLTHGLTKGKNIWNREFLGQFEKCGYNRSQSTWKSWSSLGNTLKYWHIQFHSPN